MRAPAALGLALAACAVAPAPVARGEVEAMLAEQAEAWNRGDLETFVASYWNDPALTFCGGSGVTRGRDDLLARYRATYPDAAARGTLSFELVELRGLGSAAAMVIGRYHLVRATPDEGYFTLLIERRDGRLVITHDHTTSARAQ